MERIGTMEDTSDSVQGTSKSFKGQPLRVSGDRGELGLDTSAITMLGRIETEHSDGEPVQLRPSASLDISGGRYDSSFLSALTSQPPLLSHLYPLF